jgi:hypothetical protein
VSKPVTDAERAQADKTLLQAGPSENLVSTACPVCGVRFAMLARYVVSFWYLRCTECGAERTGEPK